MSLPLTPEILRAAYDFLCTTPPFSKWNLPEGEDVEFQVMRSTALHGSYDKNAKGQHRIRLSGNTHGHTYSMLITLAHEMIHLHERQAGMATLAQHTKTFWKLAARVCKHHGFDPKHF